MYCRTLGLYLANMFGSAIKIIIIAYVFKKVLEYRDWLDLGRDVIFIRRPGECRAIIEEVFISPNVSYNLLLGPYIKQNGSEDLTHVGDGLILFSTGILLSPGHIKAYNVTAGSGTAWSMSIKNAPDRHDFMAHLHGLSAWQDPQSGTLYLYVISHTAQESIEVFEVVDSNQLKYLKTLTDSSFNSYFVNDLVVVGRDKFYITQFTYTKIYETTKINLEWLSRFKTGKVFYFDGNRAREVVSSLQGANGINLSPDKKVIYVAEWGAKIIRAYRRESTNNLVELWSHYLGSAIDNIEVDDVTGDLWIGAHSVMWRLIDTLNMVKAKHAGQVLRLKMTDNAVSEVEEIFSDDGNYLTGTSVATRVDDKLVIGTVFQKAVVCDLNYLSKNHDTDNGKLPESYVTQ